MKVKSLVTPYLVNCIPVWNPYLVNDVKLVEIVQRRATMMVQEIQHLNHDDRLNYLGLMRLEKKRVSDLIETFKFMKGMYDVEKEMFLNWMTEVKEDMTKNCLRRVSDLMKESLLSVIELSMIGVPYRHSVN